ncbi:MAG: flagellar motor protein MotB, partial [Capnocytophaga endodontalis]
MIRKITAIFLLFCSTSVVFAQVDDQEKLKKENESKIKKANDLYGKYAYVDAIKIYERIAEQGYVDQNILENLGNSYYFNADYTTALKWYDKLFANAKKDSENYKITPEYYYRYAQCLKSVERYDEAKTILDQFVKLTGKDDLRARKLEEHADYLQVIKDNSGRLTIKPVEINTEFSEYGTAFYGKDEVVYTASRKTSARGTSNWTGEGYYDLFKAKFNNGQLSKEEPFSSKLNSLLNESSPVFTRTMDTIYFTRNYQVPLSKEEKKKKVEEKVLLELYRSVRKNNEWTDPVRLPFNVTGYSVAHPAITPDGKWLYFAADINGTHGKSDIFRVRINHKKGTYGKPENLGDLINTEGR